MQSLAQYICKADLGALRASYSLGERIKKNDGNFFTTRRLALSISISSLASLVCKGINDLYAIADTTVKSLYHRRLSTGNVQLAVVTVCEQLRNIAGVFFGTPIGLFAPQKARRWFLVKDQSVLPRCLDRETGAKLYALTSRISKFLEEHGIDQRSSSGSFLGMLRHEGVIPWDDDVDLLIEPGKEVELRDLIDNGTFSLQTGLKAIWANDTMGWRVFFNEGEECASVLGGAKFPFVDLFATHQEKNGRITYQSKLMRYWSPNEYYTPAEWKDSSAYKFGPLTLTGPKDPNSYFKRSFSATAWDVAYLLYHHKDFAVRQWPQRVLVVNRAPLEYDRNRFNELAIDASKSHH